MSDKGIEVLSSIAGQTAKVYKMMGWVLIITGLPCVFIIVGIPMIFMGLFCLWKSKKMVTSANSENIQAGLNNLGAVIGSVVKTTKSSRD